MLGAVLSVTSVTAAPTAVAQAGERIALSRRVIQLIPLKGPLAGKYEEGFMALRAFAKALEHEPSEWSCMRYLTTCREMIDVLQAPGAVTSRSAAALRKVDRLGSSRQILIQGFEKLQDSFAAAEDEGGGTAPSALLARYLALEIALARKRIEPPGPDPGRAEATAEAIAGAELTLARGCLDLAKSAATFYPEDAAREHWIQYRLLIILRGINAGEHASATADRIDLGSRGRLAFLAAAREAVTLDLMGGGDTAVLVLHGSAISAQYFSHIPHLERDQGQRILDDLDHILGKVRDTDTIAEFRSAIGRREHDDLRAWVAKQDLPLKVGELARRYLLE